ncbi:MAG: hypothetical protein Q9179_000572 [Wetmoreana sp. 5 TL-2023]
MPYTPPAPRSPVASESTPPKSVPPCSSGRQSQQDASSSQHGSRSALPHSSSSYLNRHRRSPSVTKPTASFFLGSDRQKEETGDETTGASNVKPNDLVAASTAKKESPPTSSSHTPSDDEDTGRRGRVKDPPNLAELQAAIMIIEQHRESSPERVTEERLKARATLGLKLPRLDPLAKQHAANPEATSPLPLSATARKISHSRSNTEMSPLLNISRDATDTPTRSASETDLEDLEDNLSRSRPKPVRKKSGELVKPALTKGGLRRRPSSMPGTPTYSKAVHFDPTSLENVRTFCGNDRPIVVSAGTSPDEQYANDIEFPFGDEPMQKRLPAYEWEIRLSNFPRETLERRSMPVRVERIYLSSDNKTLMGAVAVANLAFHKTVVARFTLDYWKTTSEVVADYSTDVRRKQLNDGCDRFMFSIKLEDQANLENKTMFFCVRYNVKGQEFWDNNNSMNYQIDFAKKPKDTKQGTQGTALPLPRSKPSHSTSSVRPRSFPSGLDDFENFGSSFEFSKAQTPPALVIGDSPIRFRGQKACSELVPDAPAQRSNGSSQAFGNRYNFGVSLHNAIAAASPDLGERGDPNYRSCAKSAPAQQMSFTKQPIVNSGSMSSTKPLNESASTEEKDAKAPDAKPAALTAEKPPLQSKSYQELLNTYCFYGSGKSAQKPQGTAFTKAQTPAQLDGAVDEPVRSKPEPDPVPAKVERKPQPKEENKTPPRVTSPRLSRTNSPATGSGPGSRATSPVSFGYPYTQPMQNGFFTESHTPTAIRG